MRELHSLGFSRRAIAAVFNIVPAKVFEALKGAGSRKVKDEPVGEASIAADVQSVFWFDGAALIAKTPASQGAIPWRPLTDSIHLVRVIDDHGRSADREVKVQFVQ
jgi:hypothetical protein